MPSRSSKSRQSSNVSATRNGLISRRSSQSASGTQRGPTLLGNGEGAGTSVGMSPRLESSSSLRPNYYYSGLDLLNGRRRDSDEANLVLDGSHSGSSLTLMNEELPAPEFASAGGRRNAEFHELFPTLAREEHLIEGAFQIVFYIPLVAHPIYIVL